MENCMQQGQVNVKASYTLTSRVIGQGTFEKTPVMTDSIGEYVSTTEQRHIMAKDQNNAIRNMAMANFTLRNNKSVSNFNLMMKKQQINAA